MSAKIRPPPDLLQKRRLRPPPDLLRKRRPP
jgi:hypothetical protein